MKLCNASFCDFVVWSKHQGILVQRVFPDTEFINITLERVENFIKRGILSELVRNWYTNQGYLLEVLRMCHRVLVCQYLCHPVVLPVCHCVLLLL